MEKDELFVGMSVDELVFELFVEFAAYSYLGFVLGGEDRGMGTLVTDLSVADCLARFSARLGAITCAEERRSTRRKWCSRSGGN